MLHDDNLKHHEFLEFNNLFNFPKVFARKINYLHFRQTLTFLFFLNNLEIQNRGSHSNNFTQFVILK